MSVKVRATTRNKLATNPHYPNIMQEYNKQIAEKGKINDKKFFEEVIKPIIPDYTLASWYQFLRRFKTTAGLAAAHVAVVRGVHNSDGPKADQQESNLEMQLMSNEVATSEGIQAALNLGSQFYTRLWMKYQDDPESLTPFEEKVMADALHKAMKSQDSRIGAIGRIRDDNRKQDLFEHAFKDAAYG